jgi:hypothetical protein
MKKRYLRAESSALFSFLDYYWERKHLSSPWHLQLLSLLLVSTVPWLQHIFGELLLIHPKRVGTSQLGITELLQQQPRHFQKVAQSTS